jgi:hypothetical protein
MQHHSMHAHPPRGSTLSPQAARRTAAAVAAVPDDVATSASVVADLDSARATDVARAVYDAMLKDGSATGGGAATAARRAPGDVPVQTADPASAARSQENARASSAAESRRLAHDVLAEITAAETVAGAVAAAEVDATARSAVQLPPRTSDQGDVSDSMGANQQHRSSDSSSDDEAVAEDKGPSWEDGLEIFWHLRMQVMLHRWHAWAQEQVSFELCELCAAPFCSTHSNDRPWSV